MVSESDLAYSSGRKCGALVLLHMHTTTKLLRNTVILELEGVRSSGKRGGVPILRDTKVANQNDLGMK